MHAAQPNDTPEVGVRGPCTPGGSYEATGEGGVSLLATQPPKTSKARVGITELDFTPRKLRR